MRYDPLVAPDPTAWLALDEREQLDVVLQDHGPQEVKEGSFRMHAVIHVTIETQLAQGHVSARAALTRLLGAGLDRHEAVHAVGRVLAAHIYHTLKGREFDADKYSRDLDELTAESWHRLLEDE